MFRRLTVFLLVLAVVVGTGVSTYFLFWKKPLPGPGSELYEEYAQAFLTGVAALDGDRDDLAQTRLTEAIEKIPEEPAAWANRGLHHLRNNNLNEAAADLRRARGLSQPASRWGQRFVR